MMVVVLNLKIFSKLIFIVNIKEGMYLVIVDCWKEIENPSHIFGILYRSPYRSEKIRARGL